MKRKYTKLADSQIEEIKQHFSKPQTYGNGIHCLGKKYNVHKSTIWRIKYNLDMNNKLKAK